MGLFSELKRRNVFRTAAAYLALGWVVTQVTSTVAPALHLPEWIVPVVVWIGIIGFPFVLVFSWVFELTPEGLRRETDVERDAASRQVTSRKLDYLTIGLVVFGLVAIGVDRYVGRPAASLSPEVAPQAAVAAPAAPAPSTG